LSKYAIVYGSKKHTSFFFLNKSDIFKEKINDKQISLQLCFPDYEGAQEYDAAVKFVQDKFLRRNRAVNKVIYPHVTCAMNITDLSFVFKAVKGIIMHDALNKSGVV